MKIPKGHQAVMPYLILKDANKFIEFVRKVFGGTETYKAFREDNKTIMHAELQINGCTIMFADAMESLKPRTADFFIYVGNVDESYNKALENGGTSVRKPEDQSYGRSGGVMDPFGNTWWVTSAPSSKNSAKKS